MIRLGHTTRALPYLLLATILIAAQSVSLAHSVEHQTGVLSHQVCVTCIAASHLASACVDTTATAGRVLLDDTVQAYQTAVWHAVHRLRARQRDPPLPT